MLFRCYEGNQSEIKAIYDALNTNHKVDRSLSGKGVDGEQVEDSAIITYRLGTPY